MTVKKTRRNSFGIFVIPRIVDNLLTIPGTRGARPPMPYSGAYVSTALPLWDEFRLQPEGWDPARPVIDDGKLEEPRQQPTEGA